MREFAAVHQFHSGTAVGDAVTNQMFELRDVLQTLGYQSDVFAEHIAAGLGEEVRPLGSYAGAHDELLLVHHSSGHDLLDDVVALPNPVATVYHNVTPDRYFDDPAVRRYLRMGREQLGALAGRSLCGVAASNYNRREMRACGFRWVEVLPVRTDFSAFALAGRAPGAKGRDWLYVGRIVGNKAQHRLVRAFASYYRHFDRRARLVLVGGQYDEGYVRRVRQEAVELGVEDRVVFRGKVTDRDLCAEYAGAGVFVSLSEHEGFGVPLLEAMAARIPVVAYGAAAIPETLGGAGVLLRTQDPDTVAATVHAVLSDPGLRDRLLRRQDTRVAQLGAFDVVATLRRVLARAAGEGPPLEVQVQGPFETSYSLAAMNRGLALALDASTDLAVSVHATEGPGDYEPRPEDLARRPEAAALHRRSPQVPYPDVVIRQMWPPRVIDSPGGRTFQYFGWEESGVPEAMVAEFNSYLDGIGVYSTYVRDVLRDAGVTVPVGVVGCGVRVPDPTATIDAPELAGARGFTFLHLGSAFPRKGVDVLLRAYFATFSGSDEVTLVLKTFPNPHNRVGQLLEELRAGHVDPPDVRWIDRDLEDAELDALYGLADCYVHAARGEGFGLPVAEAMLADVPVIAVAHGGLADFVSDRTAVTVPFTLAPAETHLAIEGSEWAEPDGEALGAAMASMVAAPDDPAVTARVRAAHALVGREYTWEAAAGRWRALIDRAAAVAPLRVAMVSSWNSRCGIAENTRYLVQHSRGRVDYELYADVDVDVVDPAAEGGVVRTWKNRWEPELDRLEDALLLSDADVVHVQFNFGFFEFGRLAAVLDRQHGRRGVVVTLHRTLDYDDQGALLTIREIADSLRRADRLIVHQESDARYLAELGIEENVSLVPLGSAPPPEVSPEDVRATLGVGRRPLVATFGFLLPHKGTLDLVVAVDQLRREFPDILLLALCAAYPAVDSREYEAAIRREIADRGLEGNVVLLTDYLPDETARVLLRAADVIALPYHDTGESSSAALRFLLPLGRALVVTDQPLFRDAFDAVEVVDAADPLGLGHAIGRVLRDDALREDLARRVERRARSFRWDRVVADHRELYAAAAEAGRRRRWARPGGEGSVGSSEPLAVGG